jgi:hypothetical protein
VGSGHSPAAGDWGARGLAVLVAVSTFGTTNGAILTGPRVTGDGADGLLWKPLAALDPKRENAQHRAWIQAALCACGCGGERLRGCRWFVTTSWLFYGVATATIFAARPRIARRAGPGQLPDAAYPLTPIIFPRGHRGHHLQRLLSARCSSLKLGIPVPRAGRVLIAATVPGVLARASPTGGMTDDVTHRSRLDLRRADLYDVMFER